MQTADYVTGVSHSGPEHNGFVQLFTAIDQFTWYNRVYQPHDICT